MSRFFSDKFAQLTPYTPGEQPRDRRYIKLNTNESPYPPSPGVAAAAVAEAERLELYSDPDCTDLRAALAGFYGLAPDEVLVTNGSDETLFLAFEAFADEKRPLLFPDITYGFYPVLAKFCGIPFTEIPLDEGFRMRTEDYLSPGRTAVLANPGAPTGVGIPLSEIARIAGADRDSVVIVDEAYVDFGGVSALPLLKDFDNLLIIRTYSKSRSMAGARIGFAMGSAALIRDMNTLRCSFNPYNVNRISLAAGAAALKENAYYEEKCRLVAEERERTALRLRERGFVFPPSQANFLFAARPGLDGERLYLRLKEKGILVRHFTKPRIWDYVRITVGTPGQMDSLIRAVDEIMEEEKR